MRAGRRDFGGHPLTVARIGARPADEADLARK
jgi:hypothetical protein